MSATVNCKTCGREIDIAGIAKRLDGIKVYCTICGAVTHHKW
tara:strand:- start:1 stop:126 length:126 start_codon:yes stop_codon:yes gene_type:complete